MSHPPSRGRRICGLVPILGCFRATGVINIQQSQDKYRTWVESVVSVELFLIGC